MTSTPTLARRATPRRAAIASWAGGTLEYYDNYVYALASALVFTRVFFPNSGHLGTVASLATFAVSYLARPIGAVLLGHFGDRIGRKAVLVLILVLMGTFSLLIGFLPGYAQIGVWAPILLVFLRIMQGISVGGETAAATTLTVEVAQDSRRGFYTAFTSNGIVSGFVLATAVFVPISSLAQDQLDSWGWRIPFWLSIVVTIAGLLIRVNLGESDAFVEAKRDDDLTKVPIVEAVKSHWGAIVRVVVCSLAFAVDTVIKVFALSLATNVYGISHTTMLWVLLVSHLVALGTQPLVGALSDRIGRRPVFVAGNLGCAVMLFAFFAAIQAKNLPLMFITGVVSVAGAYACINASYPSMFAEMFALKVRQSGMALGLQVGLIAAGFAPSVYSALTAGDPGNWMPVAVVSAVICVIAAGGVLNAKETARTPLDELGALRQADAGTRPAASEVEAGNV
ncbi:MHS family MFS transporter [Streptomyces sp. RB6PN25]|uniref:MHS family MFS transporter n=1 Tax=Streptomyces humicola TaxID=2953240 RepID=A0ABT1PT73_9ACTN|nr:MFS transporter [Streptomyces humicola]MCQ4080874.1 MHS family MFS transporter [Streptomyces humicola]